MQLLPALDINVESGRMTENEAITLVILAYVSVAAYVAMFSLQMYNCYKYLYLKGKYAVFPICLFYVLTIPSTLIRIYEDIWAVELVTYNVVFVIDLPLVMKITVASS